MKTFQQVVKKSESVQILKKIFSLAKEINFIDIEIFISSLACNVWFSTNVCTVKSQISNICTPKLWLSYCISCGLPCNSQTCIWRPIKHLRRSFFAKIVNGWKRYRSCTKWNLNFDTKLGCSSWDHFSSLNHTFQRVKI